MPRRLRENVSPDEAFRGDDIVCLVYRVLGGVHNVSYGYTYPDCVPAPVPPLVYCTLYGYCPALFCTARAVLYRTAHLSQGSR